MKHRVFTVLFAVALVSGCGGENAAKPEPKTTEMAEHHGHGDHHGHDEHHAHGDHHGHGDHHAHGDHHGHGGPLVHRFEKAEDWAKRFDDPARDAWQKPAEVVTAMAISPDMIVADIGAGTGYFEPHLSRAVGPKGKVLALDIEADMVRYLRERATREKLENVEAKQVSMSDPGLGKESVDRVLVVDTWHHIDGRKAYAEKIRDGLRPGGALVIVDFTMEATQGPPKEHRITAEKVIEELTSAGLSAELATETLPEQYIVIAKKK